MLAYLKLTAFLATLVAGYFAYGWGSQIIENYGAMSAKIALLERDKLLITSRVDSYKTLLARRDAAIAGSKCVRQIEGFLKNPDTIPKKLTPFNADNGG